MSYNEIIAYEKLHDWSSAKAKISAYVEKYPDDEKAKKKQNFWKRDKDMAEMIELSKEIEKVILVGVSVEENDDTEKSLDELEELARTAGAVTVGRVIQNREQIHPATYVGKGKIDEIKELLWETEATGIICDDELSPAQLGNLQDALDTKVMDRTLIILDIFAERASTSEGKIQVELAQLKYRQSRLVGLAKSLSRLGGGIGTRGPGEKETGDGQTFNQRQNRPVEQRVKRSKTPQRSDKRAEKPQSSSGSCHCRLHECGKIYTVE